MGPHSIRIGVITTFPANGGYRECHIKPDLLLIYPKSDSDTLRLARLGSHGEVGI